jgi:hypothetical protein
VGGGLAAAGQTDDEPRHNQLTFADRAGLQRTITTADSFDLKNPFFQDLAPTGGRASRATSPIRPGR